MRFGTITVPGELFKLARERMLSEASFTPEDIRLHLLSSGRVHLDKVSDHETNRWIVANRVLQASRKELVQAGEVAQLKRGVWMKSSVLRAAKQ